MPATVAARPVRPPRSPHAILLAAWLLVLLYARPGYLNYDGADQLMQARAGKFHDWSPPLMPAIWRLLEHVARGPMPMLLVQTGLFLWGLYAVLALRIPPRRAAWIASALALFPPILTPMAPVWRDAQMAGFLMAGFALAQRPGRRDRALGLLLLLVGTGVRDNAALTLPPLCLWIAGAWGHRRRLAAIAVAAALSIALVVAALGIDRALVTYRYHPWARTLAVLDLAGTLCRADASDAEIEAALVGTDHRPDGGRRALCAVYSPRVYFALVQGDAAYFTDPPADDAVGVRTSAWWGVVRAHPVAYVEHRAAVMAQLLGLTDDEPWEPVCQTSATDEQLRRLGRDREISPLQRTLGGWFARLAKTIVYRPWLYAVLALIFFVEAVLRRDRLVLAVVGSGLLYEAGYFVGAPSPDFRYSHWMIATCGVGAVLIAARRITGRSAGPCVAR